MTDRDHSKWYPGQVEPTTLRRQYGEETCGVMSPEGLICVLDQHEDDEHRAFGKIGWETWTGGTTGPRWLNPHNGKQE